jgi:hypothetical protein
MVYNFLIFGLLEKYEQNFNLSNLNFFYFSELKLYGIGFTII